MKQVKCKSGLRGWQGRLHEVYTDIEDFDYWCALRGIHTRLGFRSVKGCWKANPLVRGSVNPSDLQRVKLKRYPREVVVAYARKRNTPANARKLAQVDSGHYIIPQSVLMAAVL